MSDSSVLFPPVGCTHASSGAVSVPSAAGLLGRPFKAAAATGAMKLYNNICYRLCKVVDFLLSRYTSKIFESYSVLHTIVESLNLNL